MFYVITMMLTAGLTVGCSTTQVSIAPEKSPKKSMLEIPDFTGSKSRDDYRHRLNTSNRRFDPKTALVARDGRLWLKKDWKPGSCGTVCATAVKNDTGIEVSLPVGYKFTDNYAPKGVDTVPVAKLNYWGMATHSVQKAIIGDEEPSVSMPSQVKDEPQAPFLVQATGGYVEARHVQRNRDGRYFLDPTAEIKREPLGKSYGFDDDALITRRADGKGFEVRLPKGYEVRSSDVDHWIPLYLVTFSKNRHLLPSGGEVRPV